MVSKNFYKGVNISMMLLIGLLVYFFPMHLTFSDLRFAFLLLVFKDIILGVFTWRID
jgi:hypothetical protein